MQILKQLNGAVAFLEKSLCEELDLDEAARIACVTKDSFLRFFSYMTGMTVTEYVRRRRLSLAAYALQRGHGRIIDIAVQYGYKSGDSFTKAFFKQHGITPAQARNPRQPLKVYPPLSFLISVKGAKEMDFRIVELERTVLYGVSKAFDLPIYPTREALRHSMWDEKSDAVPDRICKGRWNHPSNHAHDGIWYGIWHNHRYMIAREKERTQDDSLESLVIPAGKYAAFTTKPGGYAWEEIPSLFQLIFESWLPGSDYLLKNDDIIEVYHLWTDPDLRSKKRYYEVWIPVVEK